MTVRTVRVLRVQVVLRTSGLIRADTMRHAVTSQTELRYATRRQQARIGRTMRRMTRNAALGLDGSMFVNKWSLLVYVTLDAGCVRAGRKSSLLEFEAAVRIVAIAALHRTFQHLVMERQLELVFDLAMTTHA